MKTTKIFTIVFFLITASLFAQGGRMREKMEKVKSLKVAYITNELALTSDEAAKFWPVYNAFEEKQRELKKQKIGSYVDRMDNASLDKMTDKEAGIALAQMENTEDELYQLRKKFIVNLHGILPPIKIIKLKKAEESFKRELLQQYKEKRKK